MNTPDLNFFLELESQVWAALASGDQRADESLLADQFLGVYSSGTAGKAEHAAQLLNGPTVAEYSLTEAKVMALAEDVVLLTYRAQFTRKPADRDQETMYITSIWQQSDGHWLNIFSQDTPADR